MPAASPEESETFSSSPVRLYKYPANRRTLRRHGEVLGRLRRSGGRPGEGVVRAGPNVFIAPMKRPETPIKATITQRNHEPVGGSCSGPQLQCFC